MSLIKDLQTISRTKDFDGKYSPLLQGFFPVDKDSIPAFRNATSQKQNGSSDTDQGSGGNQPPVEGVNSAGNIILPSTENPTNTNQDITSRTNSTSDSGFSSNISNGVATTQNSQQSDLSSSASNNPLGGSVSREYAEDFVNDAVIQAADAAIDARTDLSTEEKVIAKAKIRQLVLIDADVGAGEVLGTAEANRADSAPKRAIPELANQSTYYQGTGVGQDKTNAWHDFDVGGNLATDGRLKNVAVRIDGQFPTPTVADTSAATEGGLTQGQGEWFTPFLPPEDSAFVTGYIWSGGSGVFKTYREAVSAVIDAEVAAESFKEWLSDTPEDVAASQSPGSNDQTAVQFFVNRAGGGAPFLLSTTSTRCDRTLGLTAPQAAACGQPTPLQEFWPLTGAYTLSLINGKFIPSEFDSEVPLPYKAGVSVLETILGNGISVVDTRKYTTQAVYGGAVLRTLRDSSGTFLSADLYNNNGVMIGNPSESEADQFTPRTI